MGKASVSGNSRGDAEFRLVAGALNASVIPIWAGDAYLVTTSEWTSNDVGMYAAYALWAVRDGKVSQIGRGGELQVGASITISSDGRSLVVNRGMYNVIAIIVKVS